MTTAHLFLDF